VSGFSSDWLRLREPHDAAARDAELVAYVAAERDAGTPLEIVDLGAGTGANLRWLAPRLNGPQRWRLVDDDPALLAAALRATRAWAEARGATVVATGDDGLEWRDGGRDCTVRAERLDLAADLGRLELPRAALVTASALLDLVSVGWLQALAGRCRDAQARVLFALNYDGRTTCSPAEPEDTEVLELFNGHQLRDKSFGPALGPGAARAAQRELGALGYELAAAPSDWRIAPAHAALQRELIDGWANAALEMAPHRGADLAAWRGRRHSHVAARRSALVVGHVDIAGRLRA
jgi:hypothetical protein